MAKGIATKPDKPNRVLWRVVLQSETFADAPLALSSGVFRKILKDGFLSKTDADAWNNKQRKPGNLIEPYNT